MLLVVLLVLVGLDYHLCRAGDCSASSRASTEQVKSSTVILLQGAVSDWLGACWTCRGRLSRDTSLSWGPPAGRPGRGGREDWEYVGDYWETI